MTNQRKSIVPGTLDVYPVLPLRDIVVFPHMIVPLFVGREKSIRALEEVMKSDKPILLATQKNAADDDPAPDAIFYDRHAGQRSAVAQAARRHGQGARRRARRAPQVTRFMPRRRLFPGRGRGDRRRADRKDRGRGAVALGRVRVRELREAQQEDFARGRDRGQSDRRLRQARRHHRFASRGQALRQAGDPRDAFHRKAASRSASR